MSKLNIIIPTKDRMQQVNNLVEHLLNFPLVQKIIIVDSSENSNLQLAGTPDRRISYIHCEIKSAAIQRNIGLDSIVEEIDYLAFLDDDTFPKFDYFENLIGILNDKKATGVSGITSDIFNKLTSKAKSPASNFLRRAFLLDSNRECVLLKSAVNVPVKNLQESVIEAEWLIGCSVWKYSRVKNLRFENSFQLNSVGEDVIYSTNARITGKLYVSKTTVLNHKNENNNQRSLMYFYQWLFNRQLLIKIQNFGFKGKLCYLLANTGSSFIFMIQNRNKPKNVLRITLWYFKSLLVVFK
jgi:hypothetical protein